MYPRAPEPRNSRWGAPALPFGALLRSPAACRSWKSCSRPRPFLLLARIVLPLSKLVFFLSFFILFFLFLFPASPPPWPPFAGVIVLSLHSAPSTLRLSFRAAIYRRDSSLVTLIASPLVALLLLCTPERRNAILAESMIVLVAGR